MNPYQTLLAMTFQSPRAAARSILDMNWPREALLLALALTSVVNTLLLVLSELLLPAVGGAAFGMPSLLYAGAAFGLHLGTCVLLTWTGRWIGGQGGFAGILALTVWLNALQIGLFAVVMVLHLILPLAASLLAMLSNFVMLAIFVMFIQEAHKFSSIWRAIGALMMSAILVALLISFLLGSQAPGLLGLPDHV
ncbi:YIP1 family protein [Phaeobacter sp.]|uniref:YIP1 family protein n=1 Tax=Phaeobacter sp. TaxID=1902409 RepID=UPI0025D1E04A|nr:YIP1 family protein [Phaeobacter sp.]